MQVVERVPTGCDLLDLVVGGGQGDGYPFGRIINIVGDSSSGKTFLACEMIAAAHYKYGDRFKWIYDDAESGFTFDTEALYGFKIEQDGLDRKSHTVEEWSNHFREFLESLKDDEIGIYVLDTLDGLSSKQLQELEDERFNAYKKGKEFNKGSYQMGAAKFLSQEFFKNLTAITEDKNVLLVVISQTRDKIDSMFKEQTRSGGRALDFYAHTCLWLSKAKKIVNKGRPVGTVVKAITKKSKTPRPFRSCMFSIIFDYGLDNIASNIDFLFDLRTDKGELKVKEASQIRWSTDAKEITPKGLIEFIQAQGKGDEFKAVKASGELGTLSGVKKITEWIRSVPELSKAMDDEFGVEMDRPDLIQWIEKNNKQDELRDRVRAKWEATEDEIRSKRARKYS